MLLIAELAFYVTSLKQNGPMISVLVYKTLHILTDVCITTLTTKNVVRKVLFPPYIIENVSKFSATKKLTNTACLSVSNKHKPQIPKKKRS